MKDVIYVMEDGTWTENLPLDGSFYTYERATSLSKIQVKVLHPEVKGKSNPLTKNGEGA